MEKKQDVLGRDIKQADLYFKEGSSDKEYHVRIEKSADGYVVNFEYGRRGSTLQAGTKTQKPVALDEAGKIFDKIVKEKMAKGYTTGEAGTPYVGTDKEERTTGIHCQLLNEIDEAEVAALIKDPRFYAQEKFNGKRILIQKKTGTDVVGINKKGLACGIPEVMKLAAILLPGTFVIDGEACGEYLHAFDLISQDGQDLSRLPYADRLTRLERLLSKSGQDRIVSVKTANSADSKQHLFDTLKADNREGIVFKDRTATYTPGRPNRGGSQLKFKFEATLSAIVSRTNNKRSVGIELIDDGTRVDVGNVTIPPNREIPKVGDVVEILYLYGHKGGSLYQPRYLGIRDDEDPEGCKLSQVKYKACE